ncbi:MAG: Sorbitol dehydrogenase [Pelotomaculum sp. PtaU1.Bin065]|nr:MAG: Sorbitol dehydrogenase [Pelotomaculum sp. PtaU1.Bin065]
MLMKAAVMHGKGDIRLESVPAPVAGEGEIIVKVRASGICATDIKMLLGQGAPKDLPAILGHEVSGIIAQTGPGVQNYAAGDRVAVYPIAVCGECFFCKRGRHNLCLHEFGLSHGIDGGFAEYVRIPRQIINAGGVVKLPDHVPFDKAAVAEPLSCCLAAARATGTNVGDNVLVVGAGPMGLMHLKTALWHKARVMVADVRPDRLALAEKMGAAVGLDANSADVGGAVRRLTGGLGADIVIASLGVPEVMERYFPAVRNGGIFNVFGGPPAGQPVPVDLRWLHYAEIMLTGTFASTPADFQLAVSLISSGEIEVDDLISHRYTLDDMLDAVEQARRQEIIKGVVLIPEGD